MMWTFLVAVSLLGAPTRDTLPCQPVITEAAALFDAAVEILEAERRRGTLADPEAGIRALRAHVEREAPRFEDVRARSAALDARLSDADRTACEDLAFRTFSRSMTRLADVGGAYHHRREALRILGRLFR